jgi:hypothetical protein
MKDNTIMSTVKKIHKLDRETIYEYISILFKLCIFLAVMSFLIWFGTAFTEEIVIVLEFGYNLLTSGFAGASIVFFTIGMICLGIGKILQV